MPITITYIGGWQGQWSQQKITQVLVPASEQNIPTRARLTRPAQMVTMPRKTQRAVSSAGGLGPEAEGPIDKKKKAGKKRKINNSQLARQGPKRAGHRSGAATASETEPPNTHTDREYVMNNTRKKNKLGDSTAKRTQQIRKVDIHEDEQDEQKYKSSRHKADKTGEDPNLT